MNVAPAVAIGEKLYEMYGDYERGKSVRLGKYNGYSGKKMLGMYNREGKRLGVYNMG